MNPFHSLREYELFVYSIQQRFPSVVQSTLLIVQRGRRYAELTGELVFANGYRLSVYERLVWENGRQQSWRSSHQEMPLVLFSALFFRNTLVLLARSARHDFQSTETCAKPMTPPGTLPRRLDLFPWMQYLDAGEQREFLDELLDAALGRPLRPARRALPSPGGREPVLSLSKEGRGEGCTANVRRAVAQLTIPVPTPALDTPARRPRTGMGKPRYNRRGDWQQPAPEHASLFSGVVKPAATTTGPGVIAPDSRSCFWRSYRILLSSCSPANPFFFIVASRRAGSRSSRTHSLAIVFHLDPAGE